MLQKGARVILKGSCGGFVRRSPGLALNKCVELVSNPGRAGRRIVFRRSGGRRPQELGLGMLSCPGDPRGQAMRKQHLRFILFLLIFVTVLSSALAQAPQISSITGYSDGVGVANGRWTGQPPNAPSTASNQFLNFL